MHRKLILGAGLVFLILLRALPLSAVSAQGIVALKKAGVSDQTIQLIAREKVIETAAFSIDEIVAIKKAGVSDETLQLLIKEGSFLTNSDPIVYGQHIRPIRFTTAQDVIELKRAGLSDEVIQAIIAVSAERSYSQREEAYDLLRGMGVLVDMRGDRLDRPIKPEGKP
jgi:hypothetical protein